jgi:molybdate transport system ATP-binding protein
LESFVANRSYFRSMTNPFLSLEQLSVQIGGNLILSGLDLTIHRGEQWAITGPSGSGKTVLAHVLLGGHFFTGRIDYHWEGAEVPAKVPSHRIAIVEQQHRFKKRPGATDLYYQQRFNASDADKTITVEQELLEHGYKADGIEMDGIDTTGTERSGVARRRDEGSPSESWLDTLHVRQLLSKPLIQLSNGENKRVQMAIALSEHPEMLILDNPFLGLDIEGRATLHIIINRLAEEGVQILLVTTATEFPESITHVAQLENGKLIFKGLRENFHPAAKKGPGVQLDPEILALLRKPSEKDFELAVKMENVNIQYGDAIILKDINWEVRKGEKWNVSGPNGAGKSTILSLITADNPQAYANKIWLFDRRRGTGESIWDIKQKIGFVSPELHLYFEYSANCFDVVASGLFDTIGLFRPLTPDQQEHTLRWLQLLSLGDLRSRRLAQLSTGQQRMVLLARALIKNPPMLILDEPCQGLDDEQIQYFRELISLLCEAFGTTLIYVSHYRQELPDCIDRFLKLEHGVVVP